jgi:hypothetical protein
LDSLLLPRPKHHHHVAKNGILGIGTDNLIKVPTTKNGEMDASALDKAIWKVQKNGGITFFVCFRFMSAASGCYLNFIMVGYF